MHFNCLTIHKRRGYEPASDQILMLKSVENRNHTTCGNILSYVYEIVVYIRTLYWPGALTPFVYDIVQN
jgi:heme O synthase-like polyprenyltransferase